MGLRDRSCIIALALMLALGVFFSPALAEDAVRTSAEGQRFDQRLFGRAPNANSIYACYMHEIDRGESAERASLTATDMRLLVSAEKETQASGLTYWIHYGIRFRDRPGMVDASGGCKHVRSEQSGSEVRLACGIDGGGRIEMMMLDTGKAMIMRPDRVRFWNGGAPDEHAFGALMSGFADGAIKLDRTEWKDCAPLLADRDGLAKARRE